MARRGWRCRFEVPQVGPDLGRGRRAFILRAKDNYYPETFRLPNSLREVGPEEIFRRSTMKLRHWNICDAHQVRRALQPSFRRPDGLQILAQSRTK